MTAHRPLSPPSVSPGAVQTLESPLRDDLRLRVVLTGCPSGLRLGGEIDLCTHDPLAATLNHAVQCGSGDLHVDLTDVTFIDVAGIRMLMDAAMTLSRDGRRLLLHATSPIARRVIHILGWETTPGLLQCVPQRRSEPVFPPGCGRLPWP